LDYSLIHDQKKEPMTPAEDFGFVHSNLGDPTRGDSFLVVGDANELFDGAEQLSVAIRFTI